MKRRIQSRTQFYIRCVFTMFAIFFMMRDAIAGDNESVLGHNDSDWQHIQLDAKTVQAKQSFFETSDVADIEEGSKNYEIAHKSLSWGYVYQSLNHPINILSSFDYNDMMQEYWAPLFNRRLLVPVAIVLCLYGGASLFYVDKESRLVREELKASNFNAHCIDAVCTDIRLDDPFVAACLSHWSCYGEVEKLFGDCYDQRCINLKRSLNLFESPLKLMQQMIHSACIVFGFLLFGYAFSEN